MKWITGLLMLFFLSVCTHAQRVVYSEPINNENSRMNFEVVGRQGDHYIVYKQVQSRHLLGVYNDDMSLESNNRIETIPSKTFKVDVVSYPGYFYLIYQYNRNNRVFCNAVKMDNNGKQIGHPFAIDDAKVSSFGDKRIYTTVISEDKQKILVYKALRRGNKLTIAAKIFNPGMQQIDSTQMALVYNEKRDVYGELIIANDGTVLFPYTERRSTRDNSFLLDALFRYPGSDSLQRINIPLEKNFIDEVGVKYDNLNQRAVFYSLFTSSVRGNISGLFSAALSPAQPNDVVSAFNVFPDSIRNKVSIEGSSKSAFDNLYLRNSVLKRDGGIILNLEDFSSRTIGSPYMNRYDYLYGSPYYSPYGGYYSYSPSYTGYYRPYYPDRYYNSRTEYFSNNILVMSLNTKFQAEWNTLIMKKQTAMDTDNYLSFGTVVMGGALHYLFLETDRNNSILNDNAVYPDGSVKRFATVKGSANSYSYMPKLMKQVGANTVILPCVYRDNILFARVDFEK